MPASLSYVRVRRDAHRPRFRRYARAARMWWLVVVVAAMVMLGMSAGAYAETRLSWGTVGGTFGASAHAAANAGGAVRSRAHASDTLRLYLGRVQGSIDVEGVGSCKYHDHRSFSASFHDEYTEDPIDLSHGGGIATGYDVDGSGSVTVDPCPGADEPGCSYDVEATAPSNVESGSVLLSTNGDDPTGIQVEVRTSSWLIGPGCGSAGTRLDPGIPLGEGRIPVSALGADTITVPLTHHESDFTSTYDASGTLTLYVAQELKLKALGPSSITVGHRGGLKSVLLPPGRPATYKWYLKRRGQPQWTLIGTTPTAVMPYTFRVAGHFRRKVTAQPVGSPVTLVSEGPPLEVRFPSWGEIVASGSVHNATQEAWRITLRLATPLLNQEVGFWIGFNSCSLTYVHTRMILVPAVRPGGKADINLGPRPPDVTANLGPVKGCATYMVASFHTHPPEEYVPPPTAGRHVGPSRADQAADRHDQVTGVVFDYVAHPQRGTTIPRGHPKHSPAQRYRSGLTRRPTPR